MKVVLAAALGLLIGAGITAGYLLAQERDCAVLDLASEETFADPETALASVVRAEPGDYVVTGDYLDLRDNLYHMEYGYFVEGDLVEEVNVYQPSAGSWSVFSIESCEGPSMP